jgi:hypothetical protein
LSKKIKQEKLYLNNPQKIKSFWHHESETEKETYFFFDGNID